ncbi:hypothetical protein, partial [Pseudoalteromonas distincta]|uniref:hypothetical protein n=1 Tax=Pseudoalteromonas distincta TaxID=77608 RepID=UPI0034E85456
DPSLSIRDGAVLPWRGYFKDGEDGDGWGVEKLKALAKQYKIDLGKPWAKLPKRHRDILLRGSGEQKITVKWRGQSSQGSFSTAFEG